MPFLLELAAQEVIHVGRAVVTNAGDRTRLVIDGLLPILKQRDYLPPHAARSPAERIYVALQEMYLSGSDAAAPELMASTRDLVKQAPSARAQIAQISALVVDQQLYKALKLARALIKAPSSPPESQGSAPREPASQSGCQSG
ncbi:flagellar biosynthesis repressor FlbT [Alsobacter sp. KACC 23698]|uniref:Flagellar biosynthesis repressor FlbT n=1 Tax=Alsobacter sp. KACC 23698 TaxID=3149229 RepID=A0AAU7JJC7_9HYPH